MADMVDTERINELGKALNAKPRKDDCGWWCIEGLRGNIHADGKGFSVACLSRSGRSWATAKARLKPFCQVKQDGDWEGVLFMPELPSQDQAATLRELLKIRQLRKISPEDMEVMRERMRSFHAAKKADKLGTKTVQNAAKSPEGSKDAILGENEEIGV